MISWDLVFFLLLLVYLLRISMALGFLLLSLLFGAFMEIDSSSERTSFV